MGPLFMYFILPISWDFMALSLPLALGFSISLGGISYCGILLAQWSHYFFCWGFWSNLSQEIEFKDLCYHLMCLLAYRPRLCCFRALALDFVPNKKIPRICVILLMGLWALWAYFYCFGTFALGFVPNKIPRNCIIFLMGLWALWAYFYLAFAFRLLRQVPLHLGLLSCCGLGLNYCILIIVSFAGMSINKYQTL